MRGIQTKPAGRRRGARKKPAAKPARSAQPWWQPEETKEIRLWRAEVQFFERMRKKLWENPEYREKYVAIRQKKIIDVGTNQFDLARKWSKQLPGKIVLITKVELEPPPVNLPDLRFR